MKIKTTVFGEQEIDPNSIINFPKGLLALEECTQFKLFHPEGYEDLQWLQSIDKGDVAFSIMEPLLLSCEYEFTLSDEDIDLLKAEADDSLVIYLMVYQGDARDAQAPKRRSDDTAMNANWTTPIIINTTKQLGLQKRLKGAIHTIKVKEA